MKNAVFITENKTGTPNVSFGIKVNRNTKRLVWRQNKLECQASRLAYGPLRSGSIFM